MTPPAGVVEVCRGSGDGDDDLHRRRCDGRIYESSHWRYSRRFCGELAVRSPLRFLSRWGGDEPATQIVLLFLLPFASYLIAEHIGVSGILAAVAAGMTITRSGVMRRAPLAMRLRANSTRAMLNLSLTAWCSAVRSAAAGYSGDVADGSRNRP